MKTEPTPITETHYCILKGSIGFDAFVRRCTSDRLERSRRKNIRRAWRLRNQNLDSYIKGKIRGYDQAAQAALYEIKELKAQLAAVTKQRDQLLAEL